MRMCLFLNPTIMKPLTKLQNVLFISGAVLLLIGLFLYLLWPVAAVCVFAAGALLYASMQIKASYEGNNFIIRRLRRQQILGALLLVVTAFLMAAQTFRILALHGNEWIVCLSIAAVVQVYTAFRIPQELLKEKGR